MKTFAKKLQELIDEKNLNYSKLEDNLRDHLGYTTITRQTISNYCKGGDPEMSKLKILAKYFNVSPIYFIDDEIENRTNETVNIAKELKLSDKAIEKIKDINSVHTSINGDKEFVVEKKNNIKMFNIILENFTNLERFLSDFDTLSCHLELYKALQDLSYINFLENYLIYLYYNDRKKLEHILSYIDKKVKSILSLLQDGNRCDFEYSRDEFNSLIEYKNDLFFRLNQKKMTSNSKDEISVDLNEIIEICLETMGELRKEISFNKFELDEYFSNFINNYKKIKSIDELKKYDDLYLSDDDELNKYIIEGKEKEKKYTIKEKKKYSIYYK